jgi:general secretion pathway protein E
MKIETSANVPAFNMAMIHAVRERNMGANTDLIATLAAECKLGTREAAAQLAALFGLRFMDSLVLNTCSLIIERWPLAKAHRHRAVMVSAMHKDTSHILGAVTDPFDVDLLAQMEQAAGQAVEIAVVTADDVLAYLTQQEALLRAVDSITPEELESHESNATIEVLSMARMADADSPAVKLVNSTLFDALRSGASDVHMESTPTGAVVRYRIDGVLDEFTRVSGRAVAEQVISRLKVLAELDIAERRIPQDGSFQVNALNRVIDMRVSIMPSIHGEDAVIRILDKQAMVEAHGKLSLEALGFESTALLTLRDWMQAAYGMLLVTGPTGSGKTTTLYAALAETQTGREKIITIEDPVEYQLPGVLQIPVNEKKGLSFARGLRSILRHDPDTIMVGEIRDRETAEIAVQSALTGHLVLSTVHANNVFDVFGRFTHMGLDPYALVSALNGIWAQRLVRLNCTTCSTGYTPESSELQRFGLAERDSKDFRFMKGLGCGDCRATGYKGRRAVAEFLRLDDAMRELIVQRQPIRTLKEAARVNGTRSLVESALDLVKRGGTTLEEVRRVALSS